MKKVFLSTMLPLSLVACMSTDRPADSSSASKIHTSEHHHHPSGDPAPAAVHGMVIFGSETLYASHIPMFTAPHDWQTLFKVTLSHPVADATSYYKAASSLEGDPSGAQTLLTLKPKPFVLPSVLKGEVKTFEADLYLGNFEAGGKKLLGGITVKVEKVLEVHHLAADNNALASLSYYLLQDGKKGYLVHQISAPDNFDQILEVNLNKNFSSTGGTLPSLDFVQADNLSAAPKMGQSYSISAEGKLTETIPGGEEAIQIGSAFYCTLGPDFFQNCD